MNTFPFNLKGQIPAILLTSLMLIPYFQADVVRADDRPGILLAQRNNYLDELVKADRFYVQGSQEAASRIQMSVKPPFPGGTSVSEPITDINSPRLSGAASVYWRNAQEGLQQHLESKIFQPLNLLTENYPDFLPAHLALADACEKDPVGCKRNAKGDQPNNAIDVIDRATSLYPDRRDLLDAHLGILVRSAEATEKPEPYLEASILSRQYSLMYPDRPEASHYRQLADSLYKTYMIKVQEIVASNVLIQQILTDSTSVLSLMLQGESALGNSCRDNYIASVGLVDNTEVQAYVNRVGQKLARWAGRPDFTYEFFVTPEPDLNARACPGGKIFVTEGLLKIVDTEAELAGILSHEIAHTSLSHGYLGQSDNLLTQSALGRNSSLSILGTFFNQERSRKQERAADILGTRVLARSNYAADGMYSVMQILASLEGNRQARWTDDHPISRDRVRYLQDLITRNQYNRYAYEGVVDYQAMKHSLGGESIATQPSEASQNTARNSQSLSNSSAQAKPNAPTSSNHQSQQGDRPFIPDAPDGSAVSNSSRGNAAHGKPLATGTVIPLSQTQTRDGVTITFENAEIVSSSSYRVHFTVENQSNANFIFVLPYSEVIDQQGNSIKAKFSCQDGSDSDLSPKEKSTCEAWVLDQVWDSQGQQGLILVIKEASSGARVFRIGF